jgi:hypothetical protein
VAVDVPAAHRGAHVVQLGAVADLARAAQDQLVGVLDEVLGLVRILGDQDGGAVEPVEEGGGAVGVQSHGRSFGHARRRVIRDAP